MSDQNENLLNKENLGKSQAKNLAFLEYFANKSYKVCGVPVLLAMNYEFIQVLNNMYLQSIIPIENIEKESIEE